MYWITVSERMGINLDQIVYWSDAHDWSEAPDGGILFLHTVENNPVIELRGTERQVALAILNRMALRLP